MNKDFIKNAITVGSKWVKKNSPIIFTVASGVLIISSVALAVDATIKAKNIVDNDETIETKKDVVKATWKCYIPTALSVTASMACLISAQVINTKRTAAIAAACALSETAFSEYKDEVKKVLTKPKEEKVSKEASINKMKKNKQTENNTVKRANYDKYDRCYETSSGRYFYSNYEEIKAAQNRINEKLLHGINTEVDFNEIYEELGLSPTSIGDELYFDIKDGGLFEFDITTGFDDDHKSCIVIDYYNRPKHAYTY